jgi:hypothetical protein
MTGPYEQDFYRSNSKQWRRTDASSIALHVHDAIDGTAHDEYQSHQTANSGGR